MSVQALGPTYAGGAQPVVDGGYSVTVLPDIANPRLQAAGESPVFYWVPNQVHIARQNGPTEGDYLFNLTRFAGTGGDSVIGAAGEVAGGVLTFSVTGAIPQEVQRQVEAKITSLYQGSQDAIWGITGSKPPVFRPAIITASTTTVSNVAPTSRGLPTLATETREGRPVRELAFYGMPGNRKDARPMPALAPQARDNSTTPPALRDDNLDPWYWEMHGNGSGSIDPTGVHAFSGLLGAYPTAVCWDAFHGTASPLIVIQNYKLKVWSPVVTLTINGDWDSIFDGFSAAASGRYLWASADIKAQLNHMRTQGIITVDLKIDTTLPGADEIAKRLDAKSDLVYDKFMAEAQKVIFDPPKPTVEAAQASSSGGIFSPWGVGLALNYRRDSTNLKLEYQQTQQFAYLQDHTISSSLSGMYDEIKKDPQAERKYFRSVSMDDWPRRLARICRPVVRWDDGVVEFVDVSIGYPSSRGALNWEGHSFSEDSSQDGTWKYQTVQKAPEDVSNPPESWAPDTTFVKRRVHLREPASPLVDPYTRIQIERNVIDLDAGPNGTLLNDTTLEIRADNAGRLAVGPIELGVVLTDVTQTVEAVFETVHADTDEPLGMEQIRFRWSSTDLDRDRKWFVFTGDPDFRPFFRYKVIVTVKGTLFEPGRSWEGQWTRASGNGPLIVSVPRPDAPGVTQRSAPKDPIQLLHEAATRELAQRPTTTGSQSPATGTDSPATSTESSGPRPRETVPGPGNADEPTNSRGTTRELGVYGM
ncbi:hypothetical protein ACFYN9_39735 [Streptomyces collinus]|uniref:hypothetical protein n=1 Tax=Streptomyces collinus TaxID=42684 RepID=UPI00367437F0